MSQLPDEVNVGARPIQRIAVVGAGVTGLLIGQGLAKHGFQVTVYERDPCLEFRDSRPVSFMIHWGFETLEKLLPSKLWSSIHTAYCNPATVSEGEVAGITFFNGHNGELLFQSPPAVMRRVTRQKFRRLLCTDLSICWGKTVESLELEETPETGVTINFKDGSREVADLVVGADGPRSTIRRILLGEDEASSVQSDFVCGYASTVLSLETAKMVLAAHPVWAMAYHSMGVCALGVEDVRNSEDLSTWCFNITRIWRGESPKVEGASAIDVMKENSRTFCEPFASAVKEIANGSPAFVRSLTYWRPVPWPNFDGRVTLAGDAAHSMLPFRGQGLNHAMDDALKLISALVEVSRRPDQLKSAITAYDKDVVERGAKAVDTALSEGRLVQDMDRLTEMVVAKRGIAKA